MRQGRLSKHEIKDMDEIDKLNKLKEEPHLSGAYIRSLVKQLTSSKSKDSMNPKDHLDSSTTTTSVDSDSIPAQNLTKFGKGLDETQHTQQTQQQPQQHKKQVRRRLHTTRPYQERLLNMAEARREIVTALKFHRAAMKQASEQQQQQQHQQQERSPTHEQPPPHPHHVEQQGRMKSRRNPRIYPSTTKTSNFSNYLDNLSYPQNFSHHHPPPKPYAWPASPITTLPFAENLNFSLPNQTLGLNLNFHDFNNIDTSLYHNGNNNPSFYSTSTASNSVSSPSSSSSPTLSTAVDQELVPVGPPAIEGDHHGFEPGATTSGGTGGGGSGGLHAAMDDEEMAEIRSIGEQHQMEWNDTMNLVTSAWWFKFLKTMELGGGPDDHMKGGDDDIDGYHPFDQVMEFPAWLSANDSDGCFQQHFDDYCPQDYFQNPALPCMDIGEFEGMDEEWLA